MRVEGSDVEVSRWRTYLMGWRLRASRLRCRRDTYAFLAWLRAGSARATQGARSELHLRPPAPFPEKELSISPTAGRKPAGSGWTGLREVRGRPPESGGMAHGHGAPCVAYRERIISVAAPISLCAAFFSRNGSHTAVTSP